MATGRWEEIAKDMKVAVDKVYAPLKIECTADEENGFIDYHPPFYLEEKCNEVSFGVYVGENAEPKYPLKCSSELYKGEFIVESAEDWERHLDKFVVWKKEIEELIKKIRSG